MNMQVKFQDHSALYGGMAGVKARYSESENFSDFPHRSKSLSMKRRHKDHNSVSNDFNIFLFLVE